MKLYTAIGKHEAHGGRYEAIIQATSLEEARALLDAYLAREYPDTRLGLHFRLYEGRAVPTGPAVLTMAESGP